MALFRKKRIGDMLLAEQLITEEQLEEALLRSKEIKKRIGETLIEMGYVTEDMMAKALSNQLGIDVVSLNGVNIEDNILNLASGDELRKHTMLPLEFVDGNINRVRIAMADPMDMRAIDDFSLITNLQVEPVIATATEITAALDRFYGDSEAMKAAQQYSKERELAKQGQEEDDTNDDIENSPIVQLVKTMIEQAARQRTSDIHIEAKERQVRVRFRIDGALYEKYTYDINVLPALIARLKIIGGMDISEKRKPQDGRITMFVDRKEYDIRASILPTVFGEKCVMRLAQKKALNRDKKELGFSEEEMARFNSILKNPNGILLVTGPTGSGKSTTLYTALSELNTEDVNIITVEDPVEANIDGINQVQVNVKAELTFASALRSILRQDPDIIMIGEIRDTETAAIAVQASITGHFVVSTLHTNSAASSVTRLIDMGIESYLLADSLVGVIAQRLVRRLCPNCKALREASDYEKKILDLDEAEPFQIYEAKGCPQCDNTGYRGRIGVYEIMTVTRDLRSVISRNGTAEEINEKAIENGMSTLRMSAARLVREGITTINELEKITFSN